MMGLSVSVVSNVMMTLVMASVVSIVSGSLV